MPYCPACNLERLDESPLCPLDGRYFRIERCAHCNGELAPSEVFCIHCGRRADGRRAEVISLPRAPYVRRVLAAVIDVLCLVYLAEALPLTFRAEGLTALRLLAPLALAYFTFGTWGERRTIGQHVLGIAALGDERAPLSLPRSALRSLVLTLGLATAGLLLLASVPSRRRPLHDVVARSDVYVI